MQNGPTINAITRAHVPMTVDRYAEPRAAGKEERGKPFLLSLTLPLLALQAVAASLPGLKSPR
eukprot:11783816-Alexandrium_andersonii.AAC.1